MGSKCLFSRVFSRNHNLDQPPTLNFVMIAWFLLILGNILHNICQAFGPTLSFKSICQFRIRSISVLPSQAIPPHRPAPCVLSHIYTAAFLWGVITIIQRCVPRRQHEPALSVRVTTVCWKYLLSSALRTNKTKLLHVEPSSRHTN